MPEIRTRDEALALVDRALAGWVASATGLVTQAAATVNNALSIAEAEVRRRAARIAALEAVRSSLGPGDDPRPIERELAAAREAHRIASQATRRIADISRRLAAVRRSHTRGAEVEIARARADLSRRGSDLGAYRGPDADRGGLSTQPVPASDHGTAWLSASGLTEIDVASANLAENPILGRFGRGGTTLADYRWAVQMWDQVVRPGITRGMTRADFETRDAQREAPALRRTASVYDMFLGDSDRLRVARRPDGSLTVDNGRHRIQVARELGINFLPAQVVEP